MSRVPRLQLAGRGAVAGYEHVRGALLAPQVGHARHQLRGDLADLEEGEGME